MLAEDATIYGDGGGKAAARATPLTGAEKIARFMVGLTRIAERDRLRLEPAVVNGQPGVIARGPDGVATAAMSVDVEGGVITAIRSVVNPDKLTHL